MRIFDDGTIYDGEIDWDSKSQEEIKEIEDHSIEIENDSEEAKSIRAGATVVINDVVTKDYVITPRNPSDEETALESLQTRFDNDDLDVTDLPNIFLVLKDISDRLNNKKAS